MINKQIHAASANEREEQRERERETRVDRVCMYAVRCAVCIVSTLICFALFFFLSFCFVLVFVRSQLLIAVIF